MPVAPILMRHTVTETAAGIREGRPITTARLHSAAGAATPLTAPVVAGVHAHRVRAAGAAVAEALVIVVAEAEALAVAEDGVVAVEAAALVVAAGGSECV
jgi:hypothetical protein